jgi:REP-associated tyrosine transposase
MTYVGAGLKPAPTKEQMTYNPEIHHRRSIRLKEYDYSQSGAYFVTVCAWKEECLFGEIKNGEMLLNKYGGIVRNCWDDLPNHYQHAQLDEFVIMPNHVHGIIVLKVGAGFKPAPTKQYGLPEIVRAFKAFSSRRINDIRDTCGISIWQRNYYERIIRGEKDLHSIREYIRYNPLKWEEDEENPNLKGRNGRI